MFDICKYKIKKILYNTNIIIKVYTLLINIFGNLLKEGEYMQSDPYFLWRTDTTEAISGIAQSDCALVLKGKPVAYLVTEECDSVGSAAATQLNAMLEKMTGCRLPQGSFEGGAPIYIGTAAKKEYQSDLPEGEAFLLVATEEAVYAFGNDSDPFTGTLFAVNAMLEALGFGFFGPDGLWTVIPESDTAVLPGVNMISRPHFISRRNRVLEFFPALGAKWGLGGVRSEIEHKYASFFPPAQYEKEHPEYYAYSGGTRATEGKRWWELCLSNPEVQKKTAEKVCDFFEKNPGWHGISIGQNDGNGIPGSVDYANWCECEACKAFAPTHSDAVLRFSNLVARRVYEKFPDRTLMFYGYFGTYPSPTVPCHEPISHNLQLTLCKECGFTGKIRTGDACTDSEHPPFDENFRKWKASGLKHIAIYEWNCPGAANPAWKEAFWVQGNIATDNLSWFYENGVDFVYFDQGPNESYERLEDVFSLRWPQWYVTARCCYNTNLDFDSIISYACKLLYGAAAKEMLRFYKCLEKANSNAVTPHFNWGLPLVGEVYNSRISAEISSALKKAESVAGLTSIQRARIEKQRAEWEKTEKMAEIQ